MEDRKQDNRYEALYTQLLERGMDLHMNNKRRIRVALIVLVLLPVILDIIRNLTESDKVLFLIIWVICMFAVCIYLISIEYIDDTVKKTLEEVTDREADFDVLFVDGEKIEEKIAARHDRIQRRIRSLREERIARRTPSEDEESEDEE